MTLNIPLSSEAAAKLRERAAAIGKDVETFVREVIEEKIAGPPFTTTRAPTRDAQEWCTKLDEWIASFPDVPHPVDDSRESIYAGRGE